MSTVYCFAGLPGSGKSTAADMAVRITGGSDIRAGEMIRQLAERDGLEDPKSHELANYAAQRREDEGPGFFGERVIAMLRDGQLEFEYPLFIDSVRHYSGLQEFRSYFDDTCLVWVEANLRERLTRLQDRGRDGEDTFGKEELMERDRIELMELGQQTLLDYAEFDYWVENNGTQQELKEKMEEVLV